MSLNSDLREFLELLNGRGVEYLVVGAHSLAFHGRPRFTGDLAVFVRPSRGNAELSVASLNDAFAGKVAGQIDGIPVFVLNKQHLIQNKRAVGRPQDLADVAELES